LPPRVAEPVVSLPFATCLVVGQAGGGAMSSGASHRRACCPPASKPFIGGSTTGSPLDLIFAMTAWAGSSAIAVPVVAAVAAASAAKSGPLRLFNDQLFGEIAWLIPLAIVCLVVGLFRRRWAHEPIRPSPAILLWGSWFVVTAIVFSYMSGVIHSYYAVAPGTRPSALSSAPGWSISGAPRYRIWLGGIAVGVCLPGLRLVHPPRCSTVRPTSIPVLATFRHRGFAGLALLALVANVRAGRRRPRRGQTDRRCGRPVSASARRSWLRRHTPSTRPALLRRWRSPPGPGSTSGFGGGGGGGGQAALGDGRVLVFPNIPGVVPNVAMEEAPAVAPMPGTSSGSALNDYLVANRGSATWIVAANGSQQAGSIELETGLPVMAMGGFTGSDPTPTLAQFKGYIASGKLRFHSFRQRLRRRWRWRRFRRRLGDHIVGDEQLQGRQRQRLVRPV